MELIIVSALHTMDLVLFSFIKNQYNVILSLFYNNWNKTYLERDKLQTSHGQRLGMHWCKSKKKLIEKYESYNVENPDYLFHIKKMCNTIDLRIQSSM